MEKKLPRVAYAVVDKKGKILFDECRALIFTSKKVAAQEAFKEDGETVKKVSIAEV